MVSRRKLLIGAGSTATLSLVRPPRLLALDFGSVFGTVVGAVATGLFPGAAAALGGFELVRLIGNTADVVGHVGDLVTQTQQLETHIDSVLNQVSATLATVQSFVQDCDNALHDIENLIQQLPAALATAFSAIEAAKAFARLRADSANMAGYLASKGSIVQNKIQIQTLTEKIVNDISTIDALAPNAFQSMMQIVPGIATWVQGYTAYNLLVPGASRSTNPWDHQLVANLALPKLKTLIQVVQGQRTVYDDLDTQFPFEPGVLYTFDGRKFVRSDQQFAPGYFQGQIDNAHYYTIFPEGVQPQLPALAPGQTRPAGQTLPGTPQVGDLCYLFSPPAPPNSPRVWSELPPVWPPVPNIAGVEQMEAQQIAQTYPRTAAAMLRNLTSFQQLTQNWQVFEQAINTNLLADAQSKTLWTQLPSIS